MDGFNISSHSGGLKEWYKSDIHAHHSADLIEFNWIASSNRYITIADNMYIIRVPVYVPYIHSPLGRYLSS